MLRKRKVRERALLEAGRERRDEIVRETHSDPEAVQAVARFNAALGELARASELPEPGGPRRHPCSKHPEWQPARPGVFQPDAPASLCPLCQAEAEVKPVGPEVYVATPSTGLYPSREAPSPLQARWQKELERREAAGEVLPGSDEEAAAIAHMDEKRRDARGRYRVVSQKIEDGRVVPIYAPVRRKPSRVSHWHGNDVVIEA